jgi:porin
MRFVQIKQVLIGLLLFFLCGTSFAVSQNKPQSKKNVPARYMSVYPNVTEKPFEIKGFKWGAQFDLEDVINLKGGLEQDAVTDAIANVGFTYDTQEAQLWKGGLFTVGVTGISSGDEPKLAGEFQTASDLWAQSTLRFSEFSYAQKFNEYLLGRAGIMDFNYYFDTTKEAFELINSSFSLAPTFYSNALYIPTYPWSAFGAMAEMGSHDLMGRAGLFQGNGKELNSTFSQGYLALAEIEKKLKFCQQEFDFKLGAWRYRQPVPSVGYNTYGFYGMAEDAWYMGPRRWSAFVEGGHNPESINLVPTYVTGGLRIKDLFQAPPEDVVSVGIAHISINSTAPETAYEATYVIQFMKNFYVQPDIQYFVHPGGVNPNAWMGILRAHLELS